MPNEEKKCCCVEKNTEQTLQSLDNDHYQKNIFLDREIGFSHPHDWKSFADDDDDNLFVGKKKKKKKVEKFVVVVAVKEKEEEEEEEEKHLSILFFQIIF